MIRIAAKATLAVALASALAGCHGAGAGGDAFGDPNDHTPFAGIEPGEPVHFAGTEPFWGGTLSGTTLTYTTPEHPDGEAISVVRFAGRGGVSWSGSYRGQRFALAATPGTCSDGMSDRTYPYGATLMIGEDQRSGCAWTDRQPFTGPKRP